MVAVHAVPVTPMSPTQSSLRVYFDASRLINRGNATPTGIDRVDLAYVRHLSAAPGIDLRLIRFDVFGPRLLHRHEAEQLINTTVERWKLARDASGDSVAWSRLRDWLSSPAPAPAPPVKIETSPNVDPNVPLWRKVMRQSFATGGERVPRPRTDHPRLYLNTSHGRLFRGSVSRWLRAARVPSVFFVHDLIPIEFPQFNRPREPLRHQARLQTISRHASRVLVNSRATASALDRYLVEQGQRVPPIQVAPLGIEKNFLLSGEAGLTPGRPYFVVLGTIEPRKNHALLLEVWSRWLAQDPQSVPRLVIVGRRGWMNEGVFSAIENPRLSRHVVECAGLSDRQVGMLLSHAQALLCPSYAEGFSLPVAEALAMGTPVIASDIAAHLELAGQHARFASPHDADAWQRLIRECASADPGDARQGPAFLPPSWDQHFEHVLPGLHDAATGKG